MIKLYLSMRRYTTLLLFLVTSVAFAQERVVTGKVTAGDDGSAIPGVNILEKGTSNGTVSDVDGNYRISVGPNSTLVFSFVGYAAQEVAAGSQSSINISLQSDVTALSEVVVIGYGSTTVKDATGAVAAVSSKDFNGGLISSPEQLITGKTAGVQMVSTSGAPGAGVQIRIRGTSSIRSNNNPLFVVDGVPLAGGTQPAAADVGFGTQQDTNPLNFINPNDIESISILKDASATAIYGSRGANGVVIITTKGGSRATKGQFDFSSSVSISSARKKYDLLSADEFLKGVAQYGGDAVAQNYKSQTDWQDYILRTSVSNTQNLSYSKAFKTGSIRASGSIDNQNGIVEHSSMKRLTGRVNGNKSFLDKKLNVDLNSTFSNVKREDPALSGNSGFQGDLLGAAYSANPTWPTDPDFNSGGQRSPANMLEYYKSTGSTNRFLNTLSASYKLTNSLTAKATYGLDYSNGDRITLLSPKSINAGNNLNGFGQGQLNENKNINNLVELTLNYSKKIGKVAIEAVGGYSYQSFHNKWNWATAKGFATGSDFDGMDSQLRDSYDAAYAATNGAFPIVNNFGFTKNVTATGVVPGFVSGIDNGATVQKDIAFPSGVTTLAMVGNYYDQTDFLQSYFARGNFTINDKFLVTATVRADGSSKFGPDNKYGIFPSGAVAWKMHDEGFMPEIVSTFKLRASYGIVGNQDGLGYGEYRTRNRYSDASIDDNRQVFKPGASNQGTVEPSLRWESTTSTGSGIDFGIISNKLTGTFDVYLKRTTDLLLRANTAQPAEATSFFKNLDATVENKGWEMSLSYNAIEKEDATFTISGNVSHNKNKLKDFPGALDAGTIYGQGLSGAYAQRLSGGYPLFSYHLREFKGFDASGQPIGDNQTFVGKSALPTWNVGVSLNATYKAFDFAAYFTGQFGQYVYNNTANAFFVAGSINNARNVTQNVLTNGEAGTAESAVSTRFLEKGDFFRMQNFTLGYTVPLGEMKAIKKLRFYLTGQNIFVITKYTGLDPEVSTSPATSGLLNGLPTAGIDYGAYPRPRTFTIGLNVSF
jgi:TonB-linked SusC/RagA family outer membrane protein